MTVWSRYRCLLVVVLAAMPNVLYAQGNTGALSGAVRDEQNLLVPGAMVTVAGVESTLARTETTGPDGGFEFAGLLPGHYVITVDLSGFKEEKHQLKLDVNQRVRMDVVLRAGGLTQQVEV